LIGEFQHYLEPGCIYVSREEGAVQTVLGSCVSICLWDSELKCGGMNHFIYPHTSNKELATPKYGNVSTVALIKLMSDEGCEVSRLTAHILGGGHPDGATECTGSRNIEAARRILKEKGIKILSEDVGGSVGRKVVFDIATGHVAVLKVNKIRSDDWK